MNKICKFDSWMIMLTILLLSFPAQQFFIQSPITPIRLYMAVVPLVAISLLIKMARNHALRFKFNLIDLGLTSFYLYMTFTSLYASEKQLALQMVLGINFLLISYYTLRIVSYQLPKDILFSHLKSVAKVFFFWSFAWYLIGIILHYVLNVELVFKSGETGQVVLYGTYFEGGFVPRFRGICNSPNNFGMYALLFSSIFLVSKEQTSKTLTVIIILSILLTFSFTTYLSSIGVLLIFSTSKLFPLRATIKKAYFFRLINLAVLTSSLSILFYMSPYKDSLIDFIQFRTQRAQTGSGRFELWTFSLELIKDAPYFGQGLNQARVALLPLRELKSTHNNFIEVIVEGGFLGLFFYILFLFSFVILLKITIISESERNWIKVALVSMFIFSNANVTLYADSVIFGVALIATFLSYPSKFR